MPNMGRKHCNYGYANVWFVFIFTVNTLLKAHRFCGNISYDIYRHSTGNYLQNLVFLFESVQENNMYDLTIIVIVQSYFPMTSADSGHKTISEFG